MRDTIKLIRPSGGTPIVGSQVKIVHCGAAWAIGAYGTVIQVSPILTVPGHASTDTILTVRITLRIGSASTNYKVRTMDIQCFSCNVEVQQIVAEDAPVAGDEQEITDEAASRLMRRGPER
jgi:hypothetical protein